MSTPEPAEPDTDPDDDELVTADDAPSSPYVEPEGDSQ